MKKFSIIVLTLLIVFTASLAIVAEKVEEDSTELMFEKKIKFTTDDDMDMFCIGTGVRKKAIFRVYGAAVYVEKEGAKKALAAYLPKVKPEDMEDFGEDMAENMKFWNDFINGEFHKVIVMRFVRDVGGEKIIGAFEDGFEENLKDNSAEAKKAKAEFLKLFTDEIIEGQDMTLRFAPDGTVHVDYAGKYRGSIKNKAVAKSLLTTWFGDDPISDDIKEGGIEHIYDLLK